MRNDSTPAATKDVLPLFAVVITNYLTLKPLPTTLHAAIMPSNNTIRAANNSKSPVVSDQQSKTPKYYIEKDRNREKQQILTFKKLQQASV